jgi:simple sugar transport system substrate-binding protein
MEQTDNHNKETKYNRIKARAGVLTMILVVVILVVMGLGGYRLFGSIEDEAYDSGDEDLIVVGVSQLGSESGWRTENTESLQKVFTKKNGYFMLYNNARQKQENQFKAIRSYISRQVDYIVFAPVVETGWETILEEAKEAGIPVILMDRKIDVSDESLYTTCVGSDSFAEGSKAGAWLEEDLEKRGLSDQEINIVILKGTQGASAQVGRSVGFSEVAAKHENWNILDQEYADFTAAKGKEVMADFLEKYPDIDVVVSQNDDMTFGAIEAIEEAGRTVGINGDITMISFDAISEALELVAEGTINVDVECNPNQGEYIDEIIKKLENGEEVEKQYYVEENVYTIDDVTK